MSEIMLKPIHAAILTLPDGVQKHVERIGKGRFSTAWKNGEHVYVQTHEQDYAKELLSHIRGKAHIPDVELIGESVLHRWYKMPLYQKLTAKSKRAWQDYKHLKQLLADAWNAELKENGYRREIQASCVNGRFQDAVQGTPGLAERYGDSIESLVIWCATYGSSWLIEELQTRNCAVDANGELILLDPVFDLNIVREQQKARAKRNRVVAY